MKTRRAPKRLSRLGFGGHIQTDAAGREILVAKSAAEYHRKMLSAQGPLTHWSVINPDSGEALSSGALSDLSDTAVECPGCALRSQGVLVLYRVPVKVGDLMIEADRCPKCGKA